MPISGKNGYISNNFGSYENEKFTLEVQNIKRDYRNLVGKSSDTESRAKKSLLGRTPQDELLGSELLSSLGEIKFSEQEFPVGILVSNIKYHFSRSQNDNLFYLFHDQLDYALAHYFAESKITKNNINKFLSELLMALLIQKSFYQKANKWIEKF